MPRDSYSGPRDRLGRPTSDPHAEGPERHRLPGSPDRAIRLGATLFDRQRFFEAHELFEGLWKSSAIDPGERPFWKAVTQLCVGCCHLQRGNARGARALLRRAATGLEAGPQRLRGLEARRLIEVARGVERDGAFVPFPLDR